MDTNPYKMNQWYGYDAYDGAFHFFIFKEEVFVFIDTFADSSCVYDLKRGISLVRELDEPFKKDITKYISHEEFESFYSDTQEIPTQLPFIELEYRDARDLVEGFENADWEEERRRVFS